jgi:hypothetical protein
MEALAISAANLDVIEKNMNDVAKSLGGVISNVNYVNSHVAEIENKVVGLNDEIKKLVDEIRENSIVSNARQSIMMNNSILEKKFGYYDSVRRAASSLASSINKSKISRSYLQKIRYDVLLNNPNYWLSNAYAAVCDWLINDKASCDIEVKNALNQDANKTSLFFAMLYVKLDRENVACKWLSKYLSTLNPLKLNDDFAYIFDLIANGAFGSSGLAILKETIDGWDTRLASDVSVQKEAINFWESYINLARKAHAVPFLKYVDKGNDILNNIEISELYGEITNNLEYILNYEGNKKSLDDLLYEVLFSSEKNEKVYRKDNLMNQLIIENNGDREKAKELFDKQEAVYDEEMNFHLLCSNIVINFNRYEVSGQARVLALSYVKKYIFDVFQYFNSQINNDPIKLTFSDFSTETVDGSNINEAKNELVMFAEKKYPVNYKNNVIIIAVVTIVGIIALAFASQNMILVAAICCVFVIVDLVCVYNILKDLNAKKELRGKLINVYGSVLEKSFAEITDYKRGLEEKKQDYQKLVTLLDGLNATNSFASSDRNVQI